MRTSQILPIILSLSLLQVSHAALTMDITSLGAGMSRVTTSGTIDPSNLLPELTLLSEVDNSFTGPGTISAIESSFNNDGLGTINAQYDAVGAMNGTTVATYRASGDLFTTNSSILNHSTGFVDGTYVSGNIGFAFTLIDEPDLSGGDGLNIVIYSLDGSVLDPSDGLIDNTPSGGWVIDLVVDVALDISEFEAGSIDLDSDSSNGNLLTVNVANPIPEPSISILLATAGAFTFGIRRKKA